MQLNNNNNARKYARQFEKYDELSMFSENMYSRVLGVQTLLMTVFASPVNGTVTAATGRRWRTTGGIIVQLSHDTHRDSDSAVTVTIAAAPAEINAY